MKTLNRMLALLLTAAILGTLAGCSQPEAKAPCAVCFAIANTANSQRLNLTSQTIQDAAYEAVAGYGFVSVVSIDGSPEVLMAESYDIPAQYKQASRDKLEADANANTSALLAGLAGIAANDPEADYLEGLRLAARSLSDLTGYTKKTIVMVGTGLSSAGTLDFRNNLLSASPEDVIEALAAQQEIPDLTGITVIWQQMGDVAAPQQNLSQSQRSQLEQLWSGIVTQGGGSFCSSTAIPLSGTGPADYPPVSVVELPEQAPIRFDPASTAEPSLFQTPVALTEEQVAFMGDLAEYLHPAAAEEVLAPIADYLMHNPQVQILLVGTTAGDNTNEYTLRLSRDRANTVRDTLIARGVEADRITVLGLGSSDPWHISGAGTDTELARANRKVVILDADTDTAQQLLAGFGEDTL